MVNNITKLWTLEDKHIDVITHFYPNFEKDKILDIKLNDWIITFKYNNSTFVCYSRFKDRNTTWFKLSSLSYPQEFVRSFFEHFSNNFWEQKDDSVSNELIQKILNIITEYYSNLDLAKITDLKVSSWHIIFRYFSWIYMCPIKHMSEYKYWTNLRKEVKKISDIIKEHYPLVDIMWLQDIEIEEKMIIFTFKNEKYFCPLDSMQELENQAKEARIREESLIELERWVKQAVLRVVK